nr:hypothetical protein CFP56_07786 [Quercus suber]
MGSTPDPDGAIVPPCRGETLALFSPASHLADVRKRAQRCNHSFVALSLSDQCSIWRNAGCNNADKSFERRCNDSGLRIICTSHVKLVGQLRIELELAAFANPDNPEDHDGRDRQTRVYEMLSNAIINAELAKNRIDDEKGPLQPGGVHESARLRSGWYVFFILLYAFRLQVWPLGKLRYSRDNVKDSEDTPARLRVSQDMDTAMLDLEVMRGNGLLAKDPEFLNGACDYYDKTSDPGRRP